MAKKESSEEQVVAEQLPITVTKDFADKQERVRQIANRVIEAAGPEILKLMDENHDIQVIGISVVTNDRYKSSVFVPVEEAVSKDMSKEESDVISAQMRNSVVSLAFHLSEWAGKYKQKAWDLVGRS
jgi:hypothetical protein